MTFGIRKLIIKDLIFGQALEIFYFNWIYWKFSRAKISLRKYK